jgi:nicotinate-nucleotide pyrophosphorylase (carboxylating)
VGSASTRKVILATIANLPPWLVLDPLLEQWLREDIGRGDRTTQALFAGDVSQHPLGKAEFEVKQVGMIAGLPLVRRVFQLLSDRVEFESSGEDGQWCEPGTAIARVYAPRSVLLTGERVALNLLMRLSGVTTLTHQYAQEIADLPTQLVDTRKTTPGLRLLEKYATQVGGAANHRLGLDDAIMIKDNHILAAGGIAAAIAKVRAQAPFPLAIEVETETLEQVKDALEHHVEIIMLDNMPLERMQQAVELIRQSGQSVKIEASGNVNLKTIRAIAQTGVDFISTSAPITQSGWLDCSLNLL